jgi:hypothetical protein
LPTLRVEPFKLLIGEEGAEFVADLEVEIAFGEGRPRHGGGLCGHGLLG